MDTASNALDWGSILSNAGGGGLGAIVIYLLVTGKLVFPREVSEKDKIIDDLKAQLKERGELAATAMAKLDAAHTKEVDQLSTTLVALRSQMDRVLEATARGSPEKGGRA